MQRVLVVTRAELLHLEAVGSIATVLLGDVVAILALRASERDLRTNVPSLLSHRYLLYSLRSLSKCLKAPG